MKKVLRLSSLLVLVCAFFCLVACAPKNVEKAKAKMDKAGYTVAAYSGDKDAEGFVGGFVATKGLLTENIVAALYSSAKDAKAAAENLGSIDNVTVVGKWVVYGSEAAVKAFKK